MGSNATTKQEIISTSICCSSIDVFTPPLEVFWGKTRKRRLINSSIRKDDKIKVDDICSTHGRDDHTYRIADGNLADGSFVTCGQNRRVKL